jgi:hypothetical protein
MFFPAIGLVLGAIVAGLGELLASELPAVVVAPAVVALLLGAQRGEPALAVARGLARLFGSRGPEGKASSTDDAARDADPGVAVAPGALALGTAVLAVLLAAKALAVFALAGRGLALALMLAVMLGRWAIVVQAYGSIARAGDDFARGLVEGMKFREFGIASVTAMAITLVLADAVGLVLLLAIAAQTVVVRIAAHRFAGGVSRTSLLAGEDLGETAALLWCAALATFLAAR